ncbi:hypothetical protein KBZ18_14180 [Synechococcus sp. Cruz-9H2]|nr:MULTISPECIES: hypothetical protein [unclassified Synechococcus]MCP9820631.1 hypothetical protein [Synechococcus sp. Cruz-9H2]MCP9864267.1 hypothetical protein [Synechococcus sp. Cruz-7E5]
MAIPTGGLADIVDDPITGAEATWVSVAKVITALACGDDHHHQPSYPRLI